MRDKKRKQRRLNEPTPYTKIPPNAHKVSSKSTRRLAVATLVLAVLGGSTTAAWIIHKVSRYKLYATTAAAGQTAKSSTAAKQTTAGGNLGQPPASAKVKTSGIKGSGTAQGAGASGSQTKNGASKDTPASTNDAGSVTIKAKGGDSTRSHETHIPSKEDILQKMMKGPLPSHALIHVASMPQMPQLKNGCEVTSLSMLLGFEKHPVSKMTLAKEEPQDKTPLVMNKKKQIVSWGNPNVGFVGSVTGQKKYGYAIYHGPLTKLVNEILPGRGLDLTGMSFKDVESIVANGTPVEIWDTATFRPTNAWQTWKSPEGTVKATFQEHAVLLVGYDKEYVFINNPLNGKAAQKVPIGPFMKAWDQLGKQAMTVAPERFTD